MGRLLTQNSCWVFPPSPRKAYLIQNKLLGPRSCLYHPELFPATRKTTIKSLLQSQEQPNLNNCARVPAEIRTSRITVSDYKSNVTYPVLFWKVHLDFLTWFFASVNWPETLIIQGDAPQGFGNGWRDLVSLLKSVLQRINHCGSSSLIIFWFRGIKSHSLTLHKRQRVDCAGYLKAVSKRCHLSMRNQGGEVSKLPGNRKRLFNPKKNEKVSPGVQNHNETKELRHETESDSQRRLKSSSAHATRFSVEIKSDGNPALSIEILVGQHRILENKVVSLWIFPKDLWCFKKQQTNQQQRTILRWAQIYLCDGWVTSLISWIWKEHRNGSKNSNRTFKILINGKVFSCTSINAALGFNSFPSSPWENNPDRSWK